MKTTSPAPGPGRDGPRSRSARRRPRHAESWWRLGGDGAPAATLGLAVEGSRFCGIVAEGAAQQQVWVLRGAVVDSRLVEHSRSVLRGAADSPPTRNRPTDRLLLQPTAMVQRERSLQHPRGEFTLFEPLRGARHDCGWTWPGSAAPSGRSTATRPPARPTARPFRATAGRGGGPAACDASERSLSLRA